MMTPSEMREHEFKGAGRNAYRADDVDNFFGEVAVAYEKIFRENSELIKRMGLLADKIEQFKKDEEQIKQAVIGAQKAADLIVREAETSVEDSKSEAEAILAAAKGEAEIIKSDAEKQAIADSDLLLSIARDKAESIINKAKEEAHGILIAANDSAKDTVGAATRTITSESLHYDMLKKEVSEFRASILAQYKAHIELISKLPELAVEEAEKNSPATEQNEVTDNIVEEISSVDPENEIVEFIEAEDAVEVTEAFEEEDFTGEDVVKTTLPYDFFEESSKLEFVNEDSSDIENADQIKEISAYDSEAITDDVASAPVQSDEEKSSPATVYGDIPISKGFSVSPFNFNEESEDTSDKSDDVQASIFDSFETIGSDESDEDDEEPKKKRGLFRRKK